MVYIIMIVASLQMMQKMLLELLLLREEKWSMQYVLHSVGKNKKTTANDTQQLVVVSWVNGFHQWRGAVSPKVSSPTLAQDENWFLCMSAVFLSLSGVLSVVRQSSVIARWSHVVRLWSLSTICWVMVEWVAPLVAVADGAVDCDSARLEAPLLGGH